MIRFDCIRADYEPGVNPPVKRNEADWRDVDRWRLADQMARNGMGKLSRKASLLARSALSG